MATVVGLSHHTSRGTHPKNANASPIPCRIASVRSVGRATANGAFELLHVITSTGTGRRPSGKSTWMCPKSASHR